MMKRISAFLLMVTLVSITAFAQGTVKGHVKDKSTGEALPFVNVSVTPKGSAKLTAGVMTDSEGGFTVSGLAYGSYTLTVSFVGYRTETRQFQLTKQKAHHSCGTIAISEDSQVLGEVTVTGQKSTMRLEVDRKSYDIDATIANAGGTASEVLENIPSVEVDHDGTISLRGNSSVEVWINGKASGLTSDNRGDILQQMPAESIERIEIIANPSAKFSPEGSAGIINIILKKERKAGYFGALQAGVNTKGGYNGSANFNYNSSLFDAYANVGYRMRRGVNEGWSHQDYLSAGTPVRYQDSDTDGSNHGGNLFLRAGLTWHATKKDDFTLSSMITDGGGKQNTPTVYRYGNYSGDGEKLEPYSILNRLQRNRMDMTMMHFEFDWHHDFGQNHILDFVATHDRWTSEAQGRFFNVTNDAATGTSAYKREYMPMHIRNRSFEFKLDYENQISDDFKLQAGYNGKFSKENTPQESYSQDVDAQDISLDDFYSDDISKMSEDELYYNRFIYRQDTHALYATATTHVGPIGVMAGLRGEYWRVNTESLNYGQEHGLADMGDKFRIIEPFKKDYFQLFPSLFLTWQVTKSQQLQLNYSRRLSRPWGGQLNSFIDRRDASNYSFGNPQLTPEYTSAFELNYLKTWEQHTLSVSAYYRPTTDVRQRIRYQDPSSDIMYSTQMNVAKSQRAGLELVAKNKFFRIVDLTTTLNGYYYKLDGFDTDITVVDPISSTVSTAHVSGPSDENFSWTGRVQASVILPPLGASLQTSLNYASRQLISQGYQNSSIRMDIGIRKAFLNRKLILSINCRDLLDTRRRENTTGTETYTRHQMNRWGGRRVNFTLTWTFGNQGMGKKKARAGQMQQQQQGEEDDMQNSYGGGDF